MQLSLRTCLKTVLPGPSHQAGSDSLLTGITFFKIRSKFFDDALDDEKFLGQLYGLGNPMLFPGNRVEEGKFATFLSVLKFSFRSYYRKCHNILLVNL